MTVNERLFAAGLMEAFEAAERARDRSEMIRILTDVDVKDAAWSADTILQKPQQSEHRVLDEVHLADGATVILYDIPAERAAVVDNLVCLEPDGRTRWIASPGAFGPDSFVAVRLDQGLVAANTWTGYLAGLDPLTGREVHRTFVK